MRGGINEFELKLRITEQGVASQIMERLSGAWNGNARQTGIAPDKTRKEGNMPIAKLKIAKETQDDVVAIKPPKMQEGVFPLRFTAPYVSNAFSEDSKKEMEEKQKQGGSTTKRKTVRAGKDFNLLYEQSMHTATAGWRGIPAQGFMAAIVRACVLAGEQMTRARMAIRVIPDGFDKVNAMPLVRITKGEPHQIRSALPNANGVPDIRARAMWAQCEVNLTVRWDADQFNKDDIGNLISRAGIQVGVGAGRPFSQKSAGCGWGTWEFRK